MIEIRLGEAYFTDGYFFNIRVRDQHRFGPDNSPISIYLGLNNNQPIMGHINRTANPNHTPRIMGGAEMSRWIHNNFNLGDIMLVEVINPVSIKIHEGNH